MNTKQRYEGILNHFRITKPEVEGELHFGSPFQLLVAVMLSAQCTDKRINMVTPKLFATYPDAASMSQATIDELHTLIKSVSYPNAKAKHLSEMSKQLVAQFDGNVPEVREALESLSGVGRKTANVVLAILYNKPTMAVDTHIFRVANRLGLTNNSPNPLKSEEVLMRNIPSDDIPRAHHWLLLHGRYVCTARNPKCSECELTQYCKHYQSLSQPNQ